MSWFFVIRGRGSLRYWIRTFEVEEQWILGREYDASDRKGLEQFLIEGNGAVRSLGQRTNKIWRQWDRGTGRLFIGLVLHSAPEDEAPEGYEIRHFKKRSVVRLSGTNRLEEELESEALKKYSKRSGVEVDFQKPGRLSGQSFALYQWDVTGGSEVTEPQLVSRWMESTYQLRNILVLPLLATWIAIALIGTAQPVMLGVGIALLCFLSGTCKWVFVHQMKDEADEVHLQNY